MGGCFALLLCLLLVCVCDFGFAWLVGFRDYYGVCYLFVLTLFLVVDFVDLWCVGFTVDLDWFMLVLFVLFYKVGVII